MLSITLLEGIVSVCLNDGGRHEQLLKGVSTSVDDIGALAAYCSLLLDSVPHQVQQLQPASP